MLLLLCRLKREDYLRTFSKHIEVPFLSSPLCNSTEQGWRTPRGAPNESNEAQPNYRRQGLSRYLLQIGSLPPSYPRRRVALVVRLSMWRNGHHYHENPYLLGIDRIQIPPRFLPRTRTDANFFFQSIENRGPEKGFIWFDAIVRDIVVLRQTKEVSLIGKLGDRDREFKNCKNASLIIKIIHINLIHFTCLKQSIQIFVNVIQNEYVRK